MEKNEKSPIKHSKIQDLLTLVLDTKYIPTINDYNLSKMTLISP